MTHQTSILSLVVVPRLTVGRRLIALQRMSHRAGELAAAAPLVAPIAGAIGKTERALATADGWRRAQTDHALHGEAARAADLKLDRAVVALHDAIESIASAFDEPEAGLARDLLDELYPSGVGEIVQLAYAEEHAAVSAMLGRLGRESHGAAVATLGLGAWVARIEELNRAYGALVSRPERLTAAQVKADDAASHAAAIEVVARLCGWFPSDAPEDAAARASLLQPWFDQAAEQTKLRIRRRAGRGAAPFVDTHGDATLADDAVVDDGDDALGDDVDEESPASPEDPAPAPAS